MTPSSEFLRPLPSTVCLTALSVSAQSSPGQSRRQDKPLPAPPPPQRDPPPPPPPDRPPPFPPDGRAPRLPHGGNGGGAWIPAEGPPANERHGADRSPQPGHGGRAEGGGARRRQRADAATDAGKVSASPTTRLQNYRQFFFTAPAIPRCSPVPVLYSPDLG